MSFNISLISLGCAKNLVNSEQMLCLLDDAGYSIVASPEEADVAIVNTCGFIDSAKSEAIENILSLAQLKDEGSLKKIIVTGCLAQRYQDELMQEMPEIDALLGTGSYGDIVQTVENVMAETGDVCRFGDINAPVDEFGRIVSTGPSWAYLRIAEGCSNRCAFCVIPSLRGKYRSRSFDAVVSEAEAMAESGVKELIVIAQDITRYGMDIPGAPRLPQLLTRLCEIEGIEWIRLHYLYPDAMSDDLIDVIAKEEKILKYLDIPIQHINNSILKTMNRRGTGDDIKALFKKLRERIPGLVLRTSLIAGLPGEGEEEFEELCAFLKDARIERAGVFPYSPEEGTPAAEMDRPDEDTALRRSEIIGLLQDEIMDKFTESRIGTTVKVLCDTFDEDLGLYCGRSWAESPDIDGRIIITGGEPVLGEFCSVVIEGLSDGEPYGPAV